MVLGLYIRGPSFQVIAMQRARCDLRAFRVGALLGPYPQTLTEWAQGPSDREVAQMGGPVSSGAPICALFLYTKIS